MKNKVLFLIGVLLIASVFFFGEKKSDAEILDINIPKVSTEVLEKTSKISSIVKDKQDRVELCLFNKIFADRVVTYKANQQDVNDIYVLAAKKFFNQRMNDKYDGLSGFVLGSIKDITGDDIHTLSDETKKNIQETFYGIAENLRR